jgi:hypothetical protein
MRNKELCVNLIKCIAEVFLDHTQNESEALKIITIGVQAALNSHKEKEKNYNKFRGAHSNSSKK